MNNVQLTNYCLFQTHHRGEQFAGGPVFCECCTPLGHVYKNKDMLSFHSINIDYQLIHNSPINNIVQQSHLCLLKEKYYSMAAKCNFAVMLSFHSIDIDYQLIHNSIIQQM